MSLPITFLQIYYYYEEMIKMNTVSPNSNYVEIILGGEKRKIASYDFILRNQLRNNDNPIISPFQYQTCLFNNFGFIHCPENSYWIKQGIPLELVDQIEVFDQPIASIPVIILGENPRLSFMLDVINLWGYGELKNGHILDEEKSFNSKRDYEYCLAHNIQMKIGYNVDQEEYSWNSADIRTERLHQLNPMIDREYFENNLIDFNGLTRSTFVKYPYAMFAMGIINPDMVMSIIRDAEKETAREITRTEFNGILNQAIYSQRAIPMFQNKLNEQLEQINYIYSTYGIRGLIILNRVFTTEEVPSLEDICQQSMKERTMYGNDLLEKEKYQLMFASGDIRIFDNLPNGEAKDEYVLSMETNKKNQYGEEDLQSITHYESRIKRIVFNYIDDTIFPEAIDLGNPKMDSYEYKRTMFRLYVLIKYILDPKYGKVLDGKRLILSKNFYIDQSNFSLYVPSMNAYLYVDQDYNIDFMSPSELVKYYNNNFDGKYFIDPDEIDNTSELDHIGTVYIPENFYLIMSHDTYYKDGKDDVDLDIGVTSQQPVQPKANNQQLQFQQFIQQQYPGYKSVQQEGNNDQQMYTLNFNNLVMNE